VALESLQTQKMTPYVLTIENKKNIHAKKCQFCKYPHFRQKENGRTCDFGKCRNKKIAELKIPEIFFNNFTNKKW